MSTSPKTWRVIALAVGIALLGLTVSTDSWADAAHVPMHLQAQLTGRLGSFDRNFQARAGSVARVLVLHKGGSAESEAAATSFAKAIGDIHMVGGLNATVEEATFTDGPKLAARCREQKIALVYFAVGLEGEMSRAAGALVGVDVLTIGASASYATSGAVVAFDLEEARPKLVLNLKSAKAQNVSFKSELLKLARIVQ